MFCLFSLVLIKMNRVMVKRQIWENEMELLLNVPHVFKRSYLPNAIDFSNWASIEPLFTRLEDRTAETPAELELWLKDRSELLDVIGEEGTLRYIRMTCDTENKELEK